jgi:hypothetical protein
MATWGTLTWSTGNFGAQNDSDTLVNGISASFNIGDVTTISTVEFGWGRDTYGARAWGSPDQIVNPSGLSLTAFEGTIDPAPDVSLTGIGFTAALGNENAFTDVEFSLTGISISNVLGNENAFTDVDVSLTGFAITNSLGDETTAGEINVGWGRLTWGENAWGIAGDLELTGNAATLALGNESISIDVAPEVTGIPMTASQGDEFIEISFEIELTGQTLTTNLGIADAGPDAMLEGIGATGSVGSVEAYNLEGWGRYFYGQFEWGATGEWESVSVTGISLSANVGSLAATGTANVDVTGEIMTAEEGTVDPAPDATVTGIGFNASLAVGTVVAGNADVTVVGEGFAAGLGVGNLDAVTLVDLTGISMSADLGSPIIKGFANVTLTGFGLTMAEGTNRTLIWNQVNTGTAPTWTEVDTAA